MGCDRNLFVLARRLSVDDNRNDPIRTVFNFEDCNLACHYNLPNYLDLYGGSDLLPINVMSYNVRLLKKVRYLLKIQLGLTIFYTIKV